MQSNKQLIIHKMEYCKLKELDINDYIHTFRVLLSRINDYNVVLAGVNALKLHGLKMSRPANDLDVVIFKPTEKQISFLRDISVLQINENRFDDSASMIQDENYPLGKIILKFKKDNLNLDIIFSDDKVPENLLYHKQIINNKIVEFKIQNITLNIEAKNSYSVRNEDGLRLYRRIKDMVDFQDLKNSNFNID
jgi:hypothetical protein